MIAGRLWSIIAIVLIAWFAGLAVLAITVEPTPEVIVLAPSERATTAISAAPVAVIDSPFGFMRVRGTASGFVKDLYVNGAWLVLPATLGGCRGEVRPGAASKPL